MLVVNALTSVPTILALMQPAGMSPETAQYVRMSISGSAISAVSTLIAGIGVLLFAGRIAGWLASESARGLEGLGATHLQTAAVALLGLYFLVTGLIQLGGPIYVWVSKPSWDETRPLELIMHQQFEAVVQSVISIFCGLVLFISRSRILPRLEGPDPDTAA